MKEYSVWVDESEKIVSFHEVDNSELIVHTFTLSYCFHSNLNFASNERCLASRH